MAIVTTGFNTTAQANAILAKLRTELLPLGVARVTRGKLATIPNRPCAVLIGPAVDMGVLALHVEEARWEWLLVIARDVEDNDRRADELDTWADTTMGALIDLAWTTATFSIQGGEGPNRREDDHLVRLLDHLGEEIDAVMITFATRREIHPP